jgi:hypothetical protein
MLDDVVPKYEVERMHLFVVIGEIEQFTLT